MAKVELLLSVFQPRKDKFENISFCCEKEMVFTFFVRFIQCDRSRKSTREYGYLFPVKFSFVVQS